MQFLKGALYYQYDGHKMRTAGKSMKQFFFKAVGSGPGWREEFWFSSSQRLLEGEVIITAYGESRVSDGCDFRRSQKSKACYLELISEGSGWVTYSDGSRYRLTPGTLYILSSGKQSRITVPPGGKLVKTVIGLYNCALLQLMLKNSIMGAEYAVKLPPESSYPEQLKKIGEMVKNTPEAEELSTECYRLLLLISHHYKKYTETSSLQAVCDYMQAQINNRISLEDLAAVAKCSPVTLIRNFKAHFGCTPMRYLIDLRLNSARTLLLERQFPIKDIAVLCGYRSPKFFSREYRKKFGKAPSLEEYTIE